MRTIATNEDRLVPSNLPIAALRPKQWPSAGTPCYQIPSSPVGINAPRSRGGTSVWDTRYAPERACAMWSAARRRGPGGSLDPKRPQCGLAVGGHGDLGGELLAADRLLVLAARPFLDVVGLDPALDAVVAGDRASQVLAACGAGGAELVGPPMSAVTRGVPRGTIIVPSTTTWSRTAEQAFDTRDAKAYTWRRGHSGLLFRYGKVVARCLGHWHASLRCLC